MRIGVAGPMSLRLLDFEFGAQANVPIGYDFPMTALLVNAIMKRGHRVVAFTTSVGILEPIVFRSDNLSICIAPRGLHAGRRLFRRERQALTELMKLHPVDLLHAHWSYEFAWAALDSGLPTLVTLQDHARTVLRYQRDLYRFARLLMNLIVLKRAKHLTANSQYIYELLSKRDKKKARVIPNFYDSRICQHSQKSEARSNWIVSVSNGFGRRKNIGTSLRAFALAREKHRNLEYHLIGDGMEIGGPAHQFARKQELAEGVAFLGPLPYGRVIMEVGKALVFLHPSREESFGMSVLEAMALRTPVVGGRASGNVPYLLDHGNAGVLCDVDSPKEMADAVVKLVSDPAYAEQIRGNAITRCRENYSEEKVVSSYLAYYRDVFEGNGIALN
jgi:glycosyltransferase involved in cell wall biosynthesis